MNKLQKAEDYVRSRVSKAQERYNHFKGNGNKEKMDIFYGKIAAFDDVLMMLIDLKNEQPEAIADDAHFRKHDVSGSAASEETSNVSDLSSASTSETATVSGNEQTKEHSFCQLADEYSGPRCYVECERCKRMRLDASASKP